MSQKEFADLQVCMIDEDPHLRHRIVPMKVLVLGFPRTGTSSMQRALEQLGFGKCYHMRTAVNEYPRDCAMWLEAFEAKYDGKGMFEKRHWDQLLGHHSAVCDLPAIAFATELLSAYPTAKIILTTREPDSWHRSCANTLLQARKYWLHAVLQHFDWVTGLVHPLRVKYWQCMFGDDFETNGKEAMRVHYEEVRKSARSMGRPVLEHALGDGWQPLCDFLEVQVPTHPYPRDNEQGDWIEKMRKRARMRAKAAAGKFTLSVTPFVVFLVGIWWTRAKAAPFRRISN